MKNSTKNEQIDSSLETQIEITEREYLEQYITINLTYRKIICEACLISYDSGNDAIRKSLSIEILYQYIGLLEDLLMVYFSLKEKTVRGSLLKGLLEINIKEGSNYSTETLIKDIESINNSNIRDFLNLINLPSDSQIIKLINLSEEEKLNPQYLKTQYIQEITNSFNLLKEVIKNRIKTTDGRDLPLYKVANKIKHGIVMIHTYRGNPDVYIPFKIINNNAENMQLSGYYIHFEDKDSLVKIRKNMEQIINVITSLLNIYLAFNYNYPELKWMRKVNK